MKVILISLFLVLSAFIHDQWVFNLDEEILLKIRIDTTQITNLTMSFNDKYVISKTMLIPETITTKLYAPDFDYILLNDEYQMPSINDFSEWKYSLKAKETGNNIIMIKIFSFDESSEDLYMSEIITLKIVDPTNWVNIALIISMVVMLITMIIFTRKFLK